MVREPLQQHFYKVKALHERDLATGTAAWRSPMPSSASIRFPSASGVGNGFFLQAVTTSTARPHPTSASPPRIGPARHERCRQEGRSRQTRQAAMTDGLPSSVDVLRRNRNLAGRLPAEIPLVRHSDNPSAEDRHRLLVFCFWITSPEASSFAEW